MRDLHEVKITPAQLAVLQHDLKNTQLSVSRQEDYACAELAIQHYEQGLTNFKNAQDAVLYYCAELETELIAAAYLCDDPVVEGF